MRRCALLVLVACSGRGSNLYPAGAREDDGHGELAQLSAKLLISEDESVYDVAARRADERQRRAVSDEVEVDEDGGDTYGGDAYAGFSPNAVPYPNRVPRYNAVPGLTGAVEGTITWRGAIPAKRTTACGAQDVAAIGPDRGVADVLVYIEQVATGRTMPLDGARAASVGGLLVKRNCALVPAVQIMTPVPSTLSIHGDAKAAKLRVHLPSGVARTVELEAAGRLTVPVLDLGVARVDPADDGIASAWVHALETTYYAITDDHGRFRIDELAPGSYEVTIWHAPIFADGKYGQPLVVKRTIKIDKTRPARLDVAIGR